MSRYKTYGYAPIVTTGLALTLYVILLGREEEGTSLAEMAPWTILLALILVATAVGVSIRDEHVRRRALRTSTILAAVTGAVTVLSIGWLLLIAASLTFLALREMQPE